MSPWSVPISKKILVHKLWTKMGQQWPKLRVFFIIVKDFVVSFYWSWFRIWVDIIICLPGKFPYPGEIRKLLENALEMGPKWPQIRVFLLFRKILLLFFAGFGEQWNFRELFVSVVNSYIKENCVLQVRLFLLFWTYCH